MVWGQVSEYKGKFNLPSELFYCGIGVLVVMTIVIVHFYYHISSYTLKGVQCGIAIFGICTSRSNHPFPSPHKHVPIASNHCSMHRWSGLASHEWGHGALIFPSGVFHLISTHSIHLLHTMTSFSWLFLLLELLEINLRVGMHSGTKLHA